MRRPAPEPRAAPWAARASIAIALELVLSSGLADCSCPRRDGPCADSADCPSGQVCAEGLCRGACNTGSDCRDDEICREGACVPARDRSDAARPDTPLTDVAAADAAAADAAAPDAAALDTTVADTVVLDSAASDRAATDTSSPDAVAADVTSPDIQAAEVPASDTAIPDLRAPDTSAPDTLQPDAWRPWHQPDFAARQHITLRNDSSEALVDFPVLVRLGQGCVDLGQLRADRADLLFVDADSGDRLVHEIDWSSATALHLWVRVPRLRPSGDTGLLLYYQSPTATPTPLSAEVWDEHFRAVWHMGQSAPGDVLIDSTGNANHASMSLILAIEPGVAGEARRGNGANTTQAPHHSSLDLGDATGMTLEAWVNPDVVEAVNVYLLQKSGAYSLANSRVYSSARPELLIRILNGGDNAEAVAAPEPVSPQSWTYLAGTYAPSEHVLRIYVNGALSAANMLSLALDPWRVEDSTNQLLMGNGLYGLLDELRISAVQRSPGWIAAQHAALQGDLVRFGACELAD